MQYTEANRPLSNDYDLKDPLRSFGRVTASVLRSPSAFFQGLPRQGGYVAPVAYFLIAYLISEVMSTLVGLLGLPGLMELISGEAPAASGPAERLLTLGITVLLAAPGLFLAAGIAHVGVRLFGGDTNRGYEATLRAISYSSAAYLLGWKAYIGWLAYLYGIVIEIIGLRELHGMSTGSAIAALIVPGLIIGVVFACIGITLFATFL